MIQLPKHIAIIMDGNGRWAGQQGLSRTAGHEAGVGVAKSIIQHCVSKGIDVLTLFAFGRENWRRPKPEVDFLMRLFVRVLRKEAAELHKKGIRLRFMGEREGLGDTLKREIASAEQLTVNNTGLTCVVALNYSGRWDITQAVNAWLKKVSKERVAQRGELTSETLSPYLSLGDLREPDLLIRTSGEQRLSNFLLWQLAYTELYFTETLWPDFTEQELEQAIAFYHTCHRRFGLTDQQVSAGKKDETGGAVYV